MEAFVGGRVIIDGDRLRFPGIGFGHGDSDPFIVARSEGWLVIRQPGSYEWSARGEKTYYPTKWRLVSVREIPSGLLLREVAKTVEPGRFWQRTKRELVADMRTAVRYGYFPDFTAKEI